MESIAKLIHNHLIRTTAQVGIGFKNLKTNEEFYFNGDELFPSASFFKVPVLIELFHQELNQTIDLSGFYKYSPQELSLGSGILCELSQPVELCYRDYAILMMLLSDNTAADLLVRKLGKANIQARIESMGLRSTRVDLTCNELLINCYGVTLADSEAEQQRKLHEKHIRKDCAILIDCEVKNDVTSPRDAVQIFSLLYHKQILSATACEDILGIMKRCQTNSRIPRYIPQNIAIAHKTGTLDRIANDAGIIYAGDADYILAVFYNGNKATDEVYAKNIKGADGDQFIADLSRALFGHLTNKKDSEN